MKKQTLATDFDDIFFPLRENIIPFLREKYNLNLKREDFNNYNLQKVFKDKYFWQTLEKLYSFYKSKYFKQAKPLKGSIEFLTELSQYFSFPLITSRPIFLRRETKKFISDFPNGAIKSIHFSRNNFAYAGSRKTKPQICRDIGAKIILEDCLEYALQCAEEGINVILLDAPWNQTMENHPRIKRVQNFSEARDYALSLVRI